jgi:hypothetical protein
MQSAREPAIHLFQLLQLIQRRMKGVIIMNFVMEDLLVESITEARLGDVICRVFGTMISGHLCEGSGFCGTTCGSSTENFG